MEISRGASTSIFGDRAMGGAIALFSREPEKHRLDAGYEFGNLGTHEVSAGYSDLWSRWAFSGYGRAFTTDGYYIIPESQRGSVDTRANVRFVTGDVRMDYFGGANRLFFKTDVLAEQRENGTNLQHNSTGLGTIALHYDREMQDNALSALVFHTREGFRSSFSAIGAGRNSERPTYDQNVPSDATGGTAFWQNHQTRWNLLGGGDFNRVEGYSTDSLFPTGKRVGGGTMLQHGLFLQADRPVGPARFFLGARHSFTGQGQTFFSPSAGVVAGRGRWRGRGSVYRSFRAPTLNELFREFRVGNAVTHANPGLKPETLFGAEVGLDYVGERSGMRFTAYRNSLSDLITNVTLSVAPNLIERQRQNAAAALSRGFEVSGQERWRDWRAEVGYLFVDSRFSGGARVPQVPRHQGTAEVIYQKGGTLASLGLRSFGSQFEDDQNQFLLPGFATVQLVARQQVRSGLTASLAVENLLDREYVVGFSPTALIGAPRLWRLALRWDGKIR